MMGRLKSSGYGNSILSCREFITEGLEMDVKLSTQGRLHCGTWPRLLSPVPIRFKLIFRIQDLYSLRCLGPHEMAEDLVKDYHNPVVQVSQLGCKQFGSTVHQNAELIKFVTYTDGPFLIHNRFIIFGSFFDSMSIVPK